MSYSVNCNSKSFAVSDYLWLLYKAKPCTTSNETNLIKIIHFSRTILYSNNQKVIKFLVKTFIFISFE